MDLFWFIWFGVLHFSNLKVYISPNLWRVELLFGGVFFRPHPLLSWDPADRNLGCVVIVPRGPRDSSFFPVHFLHCSAWTMSMVLPSGFWVWSFFSILPLSSSTRLSFRFLCVSEQPGPLAVGAWPRGGCSLLFLPGPFLCCGCRAQAVWLHLGPWCFCRGFHRAE